MPTPSIEKLSIKAAIEKLQVALPLLTEKTQRETIYGCIGELRKVFESIKY
jgi:hypothetical protein